jgi:RalA-binding protein 1
MGSYHDEPATAARGPSPISTNGGPHQSRSSTSSNDPSPASASRRTLIRGQSKDDLPKGPALEIIAKGPAVPISQLAPDASNAKLFQTPILLADDLRDSTPSKIDPYIASRQSSDGQHAKRKLGGLERSQASGALDVPLSSSLPTSSPLDGGGELFEPNDQRSNSEMGHYSDMQAYRHISPERHRHREKPTDARKSYHPTLGTVPASPANPPAPEHATPSRGDNTSRVKISGPMGGTPIPAGYKFGAPPETSGLSRDERKEKAKSRSFWGFGKGPGMWHTVFFHLIVS